MWNYLLSAVEEVVAPASPIFTGLVAAAVVVSKLDLDLL
jgi:hypothetical protein